MLSEAYLHPSESHRYSMDFINQAKERQATLRKEISHLREQIRFMDPSSSEQNLVPQHRHLPAQKSDFFAPPVEGSLRQPSPNPPHLPLPSHHRSDEHAAYMEHPEEEEEEDVTLTVHATMPPSSATLAKTFAKSLKIYNCQAYGNMKWQH